MRSLLSVAMIVSVAGVAGCGESADPQAVNERTNLKLLVAQYGIYMGTHQGKPPANEDEFRKFVLNEGKAMLSGRNLAKPEDIFISPRDSQPYVFRFGKVDMTAMPGMQGNVIAYEKTGKEGKRLVAFSTTEVTEVDETEFKALVPNP